MQSDADVQSQVRQVLERFNHFVSTKNMQVLAEFAPGDAVLLIGSEAGEVASGRAELQAFFARIFAREATFSWEWDRIDASRAGDVAYRISGVLERHGERWLWRQYHGSEPVTNV
jgi:ketosteroid isomerase-like protein